MRTKKDRDEDLKIGREIEREISRSVAAAREEALEEAAVELATSYPDNVNTNAFCAAIRALKRG